MSRIYKINNKENIKIKYLEEKEFIGIALTKANNEDKYGKLGMKITLEIGLNYIKENFEELYMKDITLVRREIVLEIKRRLRSISNRKKCNIDELRTTLSMIGVKEKKYIYFILGKGVIYECKKGRNDIFLNGDKEKNFITDCDSYKRAKVKKGKFINTDSVYIVEDKLIENKKKIKLGMNCKNLKVNDEFSYIMTKIK